MPHSRSLLRVARRLTSNPAAAEDLVQEALLRGWRSFHQFQAGSNARAWLFRIMLNAFFAQSRTAEATAVMTPLDDGVEGALAGSDPVAAAEREDIRRALGELAVEHRTVLLLGVVEGFTCLEIAGILSIPIGTVMSRLSRARQALRERLASRASPALAPQERR